MSDKILVTLNDLYAFIKDHSLHRVVDTSRAIDILKKKFDNDPQEILEVLLDAVESENPAKIAQIDNKYGYNGTISNMYKIVK